MATALIDKPHKASSQKSDSSRDNGGKYLTFKLANEEYGVEILRVREINGLMDITAVPQMPPYMKGVINLRGKVIPVIDLRLKFGLDEAQHTEQTCIIVVDVGKEVGIIVDTVSEVLDIHGDNIEPPPQMGGNVDTGFILGMGKVGDAVKILLAIEKVLTTDDVIAMSHPQAEVSSGEEATVEAT
ncbi:MAG TPA: chemotaxis protein CheW [Phycisphaerae bacterium]|nr:chemotaxis protein CheW [Phycisphaerae bacterium]